MSVCFNKKEEKVMFHMLEYAPIRGNIPNANNGRAYMACLVLDRKYCLLQSWNK